MASVSSETYKTEVLNNHLAGKHRFLSYRFAPKRIIDLVISIVILPVMLPIIGLLWVIARRDGGAGFYGHERVGRDGKSFKCLKIRSMRSDSQRYLKEYLEENSAAKKEWQENHKLKNDPRISPFGEFIRKTSLDELPQLFNVLKGDMSLVGPRPVTAEEIEKYGSDSQYYYSLKPGITGLWQVSGRNNISYKERVALDVKYFNTISASLDVILMFRTAITIVKKEGL